MSRLQANMQIIGHLIAYFANNPEVRFCQGLQNLCIIQKDDNAKAITGVDKVWLQDNFYEESVSTLQKLQKQ